MGEFTGVITRGINNIFSVMPEHTSSETVMYNCRIKGKILQGIDIDYNPLAVGDRVIAQAISAHEALILARLERTSRFVRWNAKRECDQTLVANMDMVAIVSSVDEPPFRPRFIDRAIACTRNAKILVILNKCDLLFNKDGDQRFRHYQELGFDTFAMSAFDKEGIVVLKEYVKFHTVAFVGQSGVGKSTIVNALTGEGGQRVQDISGKFNRGRHTTNHALMMFCDGFTIVDTPGVRELLVPHDNPTELAEAFPEFARYAGECAFQPCLHWHEPNCRVKKALDEGLIHPDRYESYVRMLISLEERPESWESDRR